ncbi:phospholipase D active site motif domain protein [Myxococcus hansupus]|uniref:Phospholipase D active site motif domain protein n=1 Tax=Pseudomyxococcus hansupus TaxID=1297742 RepID=A0A0H4XME2_9BACT|nr:phospholipase D-like domain-containing protein [Myxococcus hansupus]AKQ69467.1 phospholipase D active site motif domain protein [Myxococcus hansupus]
MRPIEAELLSGSALYREVVLEKLLHARESVWMATANVKAMFVEHGGRFVPLVDVLDTLAARGVSLRLLHAELPSRPFRAAFDARSRLVEGGLSLKVCPRVHFKAVVVDGAWAYLGSANLTGAGLGAKGDSARNFELGFVTEDFDVIDRVTALYEAVWSGAECKACKLRGVCPDPILPAGKRAPEPRRSRAGTARLGKARRLQRGASRPSR